MRIWSIAALALAAALTIATVAGSRAEPSLATTADTVSITLPGDLGYTFKSGPGQVAAQAHCLTCHSSAYVAMQPPFDLKTWTAEVGKMVKVYGASIPADAQKTIATYLATTYGTGS